MASSRASGRAFAARAERIRSTVLGLPARPLRSLPVASARANVSRPCCPHPSGCMSAPSPRLCGSPASRRLCSPVLRPL
eukprot:362192-Chlamydomonas_euryale.AAC.5